MTTNTAFVDLKQAAIDDTTLAYREQGAGEPVVFVHGAVSDLRTWEQQLPEIGRSFRAITYSRRFARPNAAIEPGADDPWGRHADDLVAFLHAVDAAPAHLVGNSQGAFIALLAAIRHAEVVRTLALEEPPVLPLLRLGTPPRPLELLRLCARRPRTALAILDFAARSMRPALQAFARGDDAAGLQIFCHGVLGRASYEALPEARRQQMRENLAPLRASLLGSGLPPLAEDEVRRIRAPALLLTGARSPAFELRLTDLLEELLPDTERVEIPAASHAMHEENAPATNAAILTFLARHGTPAAAG